MYSGTECSLVHGQLACHTTEHRLLGTVAHRQIRSQEQVMVDPQSLYNARKTSTDEEPRPKLAPAKARNHHSKLPSRE